MRRLLILLGAPLALALAACAPSPTAPTPSGTVSGRAVSRLDLGGTISQVQLNEDGTEAVAVVGDRMVIVDVGSVTARDGGPAPAIESGAMATPGTVAYSDDAKRVLWRRDDGHGGVEVVLCEADGSGDPGAEVMVVDLGGTPPTWTDAAPSLSGDGNTVAVPAGSMLTVERAD